MVNIPKNKALMFVAANEKIMDLTEDDTNVHICSIATKVPPNTVAIILANHRVSGTGLVSVYPDEGTNYSILPNASALNLLAIKNQNIKYSLSNGGDDFDLFMFGYFVEGPVGE